MGFYRNVQLFSSGSLLILIFQILLVALTRGLLDTVYAGMHTMQLLFIPIIFAWYGMAYASKSFHNDETYKWQNGIVIFILMFSGATDILFSQIIFVTETFNPFPALHVVGILLLIAGHGTLAAAFLFLNKTELYKLYLDDKIQKAPGLELTIGHAFFALTYTAFLISAQGNTAIANIFYTGGIVLAVIAVLVASVGYLKLNILFKAYPYIFVQEEDFGN